MTTTRFDRLACDIAATIRRNGVATKVVSTLVTASGHQLLTDARRVELQSRFEQAGIYPRPRLTSLGVERGSRVKFSERDYEEFETWLALISSERELERMISTHYQHVEQLAGLRNPRTQRRIVGTTKRTDVLFTEKRSGDLVICELKLGDAERGDVAQLQEYLRLLRQDPIATGKTVKGLLICANRTGGAEAALDQARQAGDDIRLLCYCMRFTLHEPTLRSSASTTVPTSPKRLAYSTAQRIEDAADPSAA